MSWMAGSKSYGPQTCDQCGREFESPPWTCPHCGYDNVAGAERMAQIGANWKKNVRRRKRRRRLDID